MHPKQICDEFKTLGALIVLDKESLYIENPENIYPELEELAKSYKSRIIKYLKGSYTEELYNIHQTVDKIINFYDGIEQPMNPTINKWLNHDEESLQKVMDLMIKFWENGWLGIRNPICNYENAETDKLSKEIYDRAMVYFRGQ